MNTKCPYCYYVADQHETLDDQKFPKDGEISFCISCGEVSKFSMIVKGGLIKVDFDSLDEDMKTQLRGIGDSWLKTQTLKKFSNAKGGEQ